MDMLLAAFTHDFRLCILHVLRLCQVTHDFIEHFMEVSMSKEHAETMVDFIPVIPAISGESTTEAELLGEVCAQCPPGVGNVSDITYT